MYRIQSQAISLIGIIALLVSSCGSSSKTTQVQEPPKPEWVTNRPIDPSYYIGIGIASKELFPTTFASEAKKNALNELASEIKVNVASNSMLFSIEDASGKFQDEFKSFTKVTTNEDIQNFEQVGIYESSKQYWVFYRLSKAQYERDKQEKISKAIDASKGAFTQAVSLENRGQYKQAFVSYFKALDPLRPFLGESMETEYEGNQVYWGNHVAQQFGGLINRMDFKPTQPRIEVKWGQALDATVLQFELTNERGEGMAAIPVQFSYTEGFIRPRYSLTDNKGLTGARIDKLTSTTPNQRIQAIVDLARLNEESGGSKDPMLVKLLEQFHAPQTELALAVNAPNVFIRSTEKEQGKKIRSQVLFEAAKQVFTKRGYAVVSSEKLADLVVEIESDVQDSEPRFDTKTAILSGSVTVSRKSDGSKVFSYAFSNVRGAQLTQGAARTAAFQKAATELREVVVPRFHRSYLK